MALKDDYMMRMIKEAVRALIRMVSGGELSSYELPDSKQDYTEEDRLYEQLISLVNQGKINESENLLFENIQMEHIFSIGMNYYLYINEFSDQELKKMDYSREEIVEGMKDFTDELGIHMPSELFSVL